MLVTDRELGACQERVDPAREVYRLTRRLPRLPRILPVERGAGPIPSTIAEGYTRQHREEYLQQLSVAQASLAELAPDLETAARLGYLSPGEHTQFRGQVVSLSKQLYTLRRNLSIDITTRAG